MAITNEHGQPVGPPLGEWAPPGFPDGRALVGERVELEPLTWERHGEDLADELMAAPGSHWTYMGFGPFADVAGLEGTIRAMAEPGDRLPYAILMSGRAAGVASYMRIDERMGVLEIGSIVLGPSLQRTTEATEALYLMIRNTFDMGYRRCEWKCDDLNEPSRSAALRLGFTYEGTFRLATHYKGRSRDTAWYAITVDDWPRLRNAFESWLAPENFDDHGRQRKSLSELRSET